MFVEAIKRKNIKKEWIISIAIIILIISISFLIGFNLVKNKKIPLSKANSTCLPLKRRPPYKYCTSSLIFSYLNKYKNISLNKNDKNIINTTWRKYYIRHNSSDIYAYIKLLNKIYNLSFNEKEYWVNIVYNKRIKYVNNKSKILECSRMYNTLIFLYPFIRSNNISYVKDKQLYDEFSKICDKCEINDSDYGLFYKTNNICAIYQFYKLNKFCNNEINKTKIKDKIEQIDINTKLDTFCKISLLND